MQVPTVKIEGKKGDYIVINESDFDQEKHKLFVEKEEKTKPKGEEPKENK